MTLPRSESDRWRVLLADDDDGVRGSLAALLDKDGFDTQEVRGGEEAMTFLRRDWNASQKSSGDPAKSSVATTIDLMILDVHMPDLTGVEVLRKVRQELCWSLPTLFVSGEASIELHEEVKSVGGFALLSKPVMPAVFRGNVQDLVRTFLLD